MELSKALQEYDGIVKGMRKEYTKEELTIKTIREDHPELDFFEDDEMQEIINFANNGRNNL